MTQVVKLGKNKNLVVRQELMKKAGLGNELEMIIGKGTIILLSPITNSAKSALVEFGKNAPSGKWSDASTNHDKYLYRKI